MNNSIHSVITQNGLGQYLRRIFRYSLHCTDISTNRRVSRAFRYSSAFRLLHSVVHIHPRLPHSTVHVHSGLPHSIVHVHPDYDDSAVRIHPGCCIPLFIFIPVSTHSIVHDIPDCQHSAVHVHSGCDSGAFGVRVNDLMTYLLHFINSPLYYRCLWKKYSNEKSYHQTMEFLFNMPYNQIHTYIPVADSLHGFSSFVVYVSSFCCRSTSTLHCTTADKGTISGFFIDIQLPCNSKIPLIVIT